MSFNNNNNNNNNNNYYYYYYNNSLAYLIDLNDSIPTNLKYYHCFIKLYPILNNLYQYLSK
jgi:hypothetical protein